jgi:hypothetical protein
VSQTTWVNLNISPNGMPGPASGGDQGAGHITVSYDPSKFTTAVSLEAVLAALRVALQGRGFR